MNVPDKTMQVPDVVAGCKGLVRGMLPYWHQIKLFFMRVVRQKSSECYSGVWSFWKSGVWGNRRGKNRRCYWIESGRGWKGKKREGSATSQRLMWLFKKRGKINDLRASVCLSVNTINQVVAYKRGIYFSQFWRLVLANSESGENPLPDS